MASAVQRSLEHALVLPQAPVGFYQKLNGLWTKAIDDIANGRMDALHALQQAQQQAGR